MADELAARAIEMLPRHDIEPDPGNPRRSSPDEVLDVSDILEDVRANGVRDPLWVRRLDDAHDGGVRAHYQIIRGERRWTAAGIAGIESVPCEIRDDIDAAGRLALQLSDGTAPLSPLAEARGLGRLRDEHGLTPVAIAAKTNKPEGIVGKYLALLVAIPEMQARLRDGAATVDACALFGRHPEAAQREAWAALDRMYGAGTEDVISADKWLRGLFAKLPLASAPWPLDAQPSGFSRACVGCPSRSDAQAALPGLDEGTSAYCLDRSCYEAKGEAWEKLEAARKRADKAQAADDDEGGEVGDPADPHGLLADRERGREALVQVRKSSAGPAVSAPVREHGQALPRAPKPVGPSAADAEKMQREAERSARQKALAKIGSHFAKRKVDAKFWTLLARLVLCDVDAAFGGLVLDALDRRGISGGLTDAQARQRLLTQIAGASESECRGFIVEMLAAADDTGKEDDVFILAARAAKVDIGALEAEELEKLRVKNKPVEPGPKKATRQPSAKAPAAATKPACDCRPVPRKGPCKSTCASKVKPSLSDTMRSAESSLDEQLARGAPTPPVAKGEPTPAGTCAACGCTSAKPCDGCCWADESETLCSYCAQMGETVLDEIGQSKAGVSPEQLCEVMDTVFEEEGWYGPARRDKILAVLVQRERIVLLGQKYCMAPDAGEKPRAPDAASPKLSAAAHKKVLRETEEGALAFLAGRSMTEDKLLYAIAFADEQEAARAALRALVVEGKLVCVIDDDVRTYSLPGGERALDAAAPAPPCSLTWEMVQALATSLKIEPHEGANSPENVWGCAGRILADIDEKHPLAVSLVELLNIFGGMAGHGDHNVLLALAYLVERGTLARNAGKPPVKGALYRIAPFEGTRSGPTPMPLPGAKTAPAVVRIWAGKGLAHRRGDGGIASRYTLCDQQIGPKWTIAPSAVKPCPGCDDAHAKEAAAAAERDVLRRGPTTPVLPPSLVDERLLTLIVVSCKSARTTAQLEVACNGFFKVHHQASTLSARKAATADALDQLIKAKRLTRDKGKFIAVKA